MKEIDDLEAKQIEDVKKRKDRIDKKKEEIKKPNIPQIPEVEEEDHAMKDIEGLVEDEGGNTSVDYGMEDTPSNYNEMN